MTNKDRLISLIGFTPSNSNTLDGALIDLGLVGTNLYTVQSTISVKKAAIQVIQVILSTPDTNDQNFSIKYDRGALLKLLATLKDEVGERDPLLIPTITVKRVW